MLGERTIRGLLTEGLRASPADETEILLLSTHASLTRFANNAIHQNVSESNVEVAVRTVVRKRVGASITNRLTPEGIQAAVSRAAAIAAVAPEVPDFPGLPEPEPVASVASFDEAVASASPEWRARQVQEVLRLTESAGALAAGALSTDVTEVAVANSRGVFCYHVGTRVRFRTVVLKEGASGYGERAGWHISAFDPVAVARDAVERAMRAQNPREIPPGTYPVVLEPYAVQDILGWLGYAGAGALAVQEGRSWMNGRIGTQALSELVTIWDDGCDPAGIPLPFDFEGVPKQRVVLVERGVPKGPVYDTVTASREGMRSTGHALPRAWPEYASLGPLPTNLFMAPGDASTEEMVRSLQRGLWITRFWYTRLVHPRDCVVTGMTRDGTFWVEGGEVAYPVRNLRFTQGYVQALASVERVGAQAWLLSDRFGADHVPGLLLSTFTFTGVTEF